MLIARTLTAGLLAACSLLLPATAQDLDDVGVAFLANIDAGAVDVFLADDRVDFSVRASTLYSFVVPVNITRGDSASDALDVSVYVGTWDADIDSEPDEAQVYLERIFLDGTSAYDVFARFNLSVANGTEPVFAVRAEVVEADPPGGVYQQTLPGTAIFAYSAGQSAWSTLPTADHAQRVNEVAQVLFDEAMANVTEPPIDTTPIADDSDIDLTILVPGWNETDTTDNEGNGTTVPPVGHNSTVPPVGHNSTVPPPGHDSTVPPPGHPSSTPCESDKDKPTPTPSPSPCDCNKHKSTPTSTPCDESTKTKRPHHPHWKPDYDSKDTSTPCSTTPTPWATAYARRAVAERQAAAPKATLGLTMTYGAKDTVRPVRQLSVTAEGVRDGKKVTAKSRTDNSGFASFEFNSPAGSTIIVNRLWVSLDAVGFRVSSASSEQGPFTPYRFYNVDALGWQLEEAGSASLRSFRWTSQNAVDVFSVQDRMQNAYVFAKYNVWPGKPAAFPKLPNVWFPGTDKANYFSGGSSEFINIRPVSPLASVVIGHEFGHWLHYLARNKADLPTLYGKAGHEFCEVQEPQDSLKEGYATAFALISLKVPVTTPPPRYTPVGSLFNQGEGSSYCFAKLTDGCLAIEQYSCDLSDLSTDEGRVAAALLDLADRQPIFNDNSAGNSLIGNTAGRDTAQFKLRRVFWQSLQQNPTSMQEYWDNFKVTTPTLSQNLLSAAWNIMVYNYATPTITE